jgi:hypothetical protein
MLGVKRVDKQYRYFSSVGKFLVLSFWFLVRAPVVIVSLSNHDALEVLPPGRVSFFDKLRMTRLGLWRVYKLPTTN